MNRITIARPFKGLTLKDGTAVLRDNPRYMQIDFSEVREEFGVWDNFGRWDRVEKLNLYDLDTLVDLVSKHTTVKKMSELVRAEKDKDRRNFLKATRLPSVFFGEFSPVQRDNGTWKILKKGCLINHSQIICIDIDNIDPTMMWVVAQKIDQDPYTLMRFTSASGNGYKLLMRTDSGIDEETHELYYIEAMKYWKSSLPLEVKVDAGCKDLSRRCYLSHDPEPYVNKECSVWTEKAEPAPVYVYSPRVINEILKMDAFTIVEDAAERVRSGKRGSKEKGTDRVVEYKWDFVDGQRHDFLVHLTAICKGWKMPEWEFRQAAGHYISGTSDGDQVVRTQYARG